MSSWARFIAVFMLTLWLQTNVQGQDVMYHYYRMRASSGGGSGEYIRNYYGHNGGNYGISFYSNGAARMHLVGGRLGIGVTVPTQALDVSGNGKFSGSMTLGSGLTIGSTLNANDKQLQNVQALQLIDWDDNNNGTNNTYRLLGRDNTFMFYNGGIVVGQYGNNTVTNIGTGEMLVQHHIGVGTTDPGAPIHVEAESSTSPSANGIYVYQSSTNQDAIIAARVNANGSGDPFYSVDVSGEAGWSFGMDNNDGNKFKIAASWSQLETNTRFTIDDAGKVGIGTTTPDQELEVNGDILLSNSGGLKSIYTWSGTDHNWRIGMQDNDGEIGFTRALTTSHVQYITYANGSTQGFAVGVNNGNSSFEIKASDHQAYFRGNVGIGGSTTRAKLNVQGSAGIGKSVGIDNREIKFYGDGYAHMSIFGAKDASNKYIAFNNTSSNVNMGTEGTNIMSVHFDGKVGIGNTSPSDMLTVGSSVTGGDVRVYGTVEVKELHIDPTGVWADHVFAADYQLRSLSEVEEFINENNHLPEVPSANKVATHGYNQTEINATLLQKIEELTLYMIQLEKKNAALTSEVEELKKVNR